MPSFEGGVDFLFAELAAGAEGSEVVCVVAHARVLPVDEVVLARCVDEKVEHEEIVVTKTGGGRCLPG